MLPFIPDTVCDDEGLGGALHAMSRDASRWPGSRSLDLGNERGPCGVEYLSLGPQSVRIGYRPILPGDEYQLQISERAGLARSVEKVRRGERRARIVVNVF